MCHCRTCMFFLKTLSGYDVGEASVREGPTAFYTRSGLKAVAIPVLCAR